MSDLTRARYRLGRCPCQLKPVPGCDGSLREAPELLQEVESATRDGDVISDALAHYIARTYRGCPSVVCRFFFYGDMPEDGGGPEAFQREIESHIADLHKHENMHIYREGSPWAASHGTVAQQEVLLRALWTYADRRRA